MTVSSNSARSFSGRLAIAASAIALASVCMTARAQAVHDYSSSAGYKALYRNVDFDGSSLASAPSPSLAPAPQYGQTNGQYPTTRYPAYQSKWSHLAFEVGGGLTAPIGNTGHYETYGGNFRVGGGWNFNKWLGALAEFEFDSNKIPGKILAGVGAPGGHVHIWSISADPIIYLPTTGRFGAYMTGGGGYYHKTTAYTTPILQCNYFYGYCGYVNQTIGQFSSGQAGLNIGAGGTWKAFGPDSRAKLYAEVRYEWVDSPAASVKEPYNTGTENLIPVTFGIRW